MPPHVLGMYSTMLPRIEASERLDRISDLLAVEGRMLEDHSRQRYMGGLERQLQGRRRVKRVSRDDLTAMHVQVVVEEGQPKKKSAKKGR